VIQRALILLNGDLIEVEDLCFEQDVSILHNRPATVAAEPTEDDGLGNGLKSRESELILDALRDQGSRKAAAERLGISPRTLRYKLARMREQGIAVPA
jgi:two-component system response regulator FlrC